MKTTVRLQFSRFYSAAGRAWVRDEISSHSNRFANAMLGGFKHSTGKKARPAWAPTNLAGMRFVLPQKFSPFRITVNRVMMLSNPAVAMNGVAL
jgi:hypothetical protein